MTVHCTIATAWALNSVARGRRFTAWEATWPTREDVTTYTPLFWTDEAVELLTPGSKASLADMRRKFVKDRESVAEVLLEAGVSETEFKYYWIMVNSRCFFWNLAKSNKRKRGESPLPADECMALCPYADYFNHTNKGCSFATSEAGCQVVSDRHYEQGEEITLRYGPHDNDTLHVEYGFLLENNEADLIKIDDFVLANLKLNPEVMDVLEENDYLNNYTVDRHGVCYRTEIALAGTVLDGKVFAEYLMSHELDYNSETLVQRSLKSFYDQLEYGYSQGLAACQTSRLAGPQKEMAERRWQECVELLKLANKSLG